VEWSELSDDNGSLVRYVADTRDGLPIADLAELIPDRTIDDAITALLKNNAGHLLATQDAALARGLLSAGAREVRHAYVMSADTSAHRDAAVIDIVPRQSVEARSLLPGWLAAYPDGHPDHEAGTVDEIVARCWDWYDEPEWLAREHRSSGLVMSGGSAVAGIIVSIRPQPAPYGGPWVHDVWRVPGNSEPRIGGALLAQAMRLLDEDGYPALGLTVSHGNPARRVYERLGFVEQLESWTVHIPDS
jgi:ribosomal protein S18 acetylase RimI-like enzyme